VRLARIGLELAVQDELETFEFFDFGLSLEHPSSSAPIIVSDRVQSIGRCQTLESRIEIRI
jgi:hypothetical protein